VATFSAGVAVLVWSGVDPLPPQPGSSIKVNTAQQAHRNMRMPTFFMAATSFFVHLLGALQTAGF
jgi:hypothetical protein